MSEDQPQESQPSRDPQAGNENQPSWGNAYPRPEQQPPGYSQPGYSQPGQGYPPPGYGYGYPPPGQGYPPPGYGYPPPGYAPFAPQPPKHESATTAMVLGLVGTVGALACTLPVVVAPFAWHTGAKALREIDASQGALGGRSEAKAGMILGIIGTVLLVLAVAAIITLIVLSFTVDDFWSDDDLDGTTVETMVSGLAALLR